MGRFGASAALLLGSGFAILAVIALVLVGKRAASPSSTNLRMPHFTYSVSVRQRRSRFAWESKATSVWLTCEEPSHEFPQW